MNILRCSAILRLTAVDRHAASRGFLLVLVPMLVIFNVMLDLVLLALLWARFRHVTVARRLVNAAVSILITKTDGAARKSVVI